MISAGTLDLPYPVPFDLLGENAKGWLQTDYLTSSLRLSRGNKGSLFVLVPEADDDPEALAALLSRGIPGGPPRGASADSSPSTAQEAGGQSADAVTRAERNPVIVCPAQFGTAEDYEELVDALRSRGHPTTVVPLRRRDWFRLIPASLTAEYWRGELRPETALPFYFESLDKAADAAVAASPGRPISLVAHSIGGWVARAYLGQLSEAKRSRFGDARRDRRSPPQTPAASPCRLRAGAHLRLSPQARWSPSGRRTPLRPTASFAHSTRRVGCSRTSRPTTPAPTTTPSVT